MNSILQAPIQIDLGDGTSPIIMVDDEEMDYTLVKHFHKLSGITNPLIHLSSGAAFIDYIKATKETNAPLPVFALMDINMPCMDGFETVETMMEDEYFCDCPIVVMMMSSSDDPHDRQRAVTAGASGYLVKPYNPKNYLDFFSSLIQT